jgi:hypothetical protein
MGLHIWPLSLLAVSSLYLAPVFLEHGKPNGPRTPSAMSNAQLTPLLLAANSLYLALIG